MDTNFRKTFGWASACAGIILILLYFFGKSGSIAYLFMGIGGTVTGIGLATNFFNKKENQE
jgi:hypothetical protein